MRIAVIDLGTNTFHLMIVDELLVGGYKKVLKQKTNVKLGKGTINSNLIDVPAFNRGLKALQGYKSKCEDLGVESILAFATSAIRSASNGGDFVDTVRKLTGISIQVISGDREAELIYKGVRETKVLTSDKSVVMDIGGGSVEFIIADQEHIYWKKSYNIGVARLLQRFKPSNPITEEELSSVSTYLSEELSELIEESRKYGVRTLVGASGAFDSFADMIEEKHRARKISRSALSYKFDLKEYEQTHTWLLQSTAIERRVTKGILRMRVDMIVLSSVLVHFVLDQLEIKELLLSAYALKEGALVEHLDKALKP